MGHVDHAQQSVRNGQTDRRQHQNRTERQAGKDPPQPLAPTQSRFHLSQRGRSRAANPAVLIAPFGRNPRQQGPHGRQLTARERPHGLEAALGLGSARSGEGLNHAQNGQHRRIPFGRQRPIEHGQHG